MAPSSPANLNNTAVVAASVAAPAGNRGCQSFKEFMTTGGEEEEKEGEELEEEKEKKEREE